MFLYILNMHKENMIKIGIATGVERIKQHLKTYNNLIDLEESFIITSKDDSTIKILEKQLLEDYCEFKVVSNKFKGLDGSTELRDIKILDSVLKDIEYKAKKFKIKEIDIKKGISINLHKKIAVKRKRRLSYKFIDQGYSAVINNFINKLNNNKEKIRDFKMVRYEATMLTKFTITFTEDVDWWRELEVMTTSYHHDSLSNICVIHFTVKHDTNKIDLLFDFKFLRDAPQGTLEHEEMCLYNAVINYAKLNNIV